MVKLTNQTLDLLEHSMSNALANIHPQSTRSQEHLGANLYACNDWNFALQLPYHSDFMTGWSRCNLTDHCMIQQENCTSRR